LAPWRIPPWFEYRETTTYTNNEYGQKIVADFTTKVALNVISWSALVVAGGVVFVVLGWPWRKCQVCAKPEAPSNGGADAPAPPLA
jgi:hypothetical protein